MDEQRISNWRWGLYAGCLAFSVFVPVVGGIVEKTGGWVLPLTILYILWAILFALFGLTFFERSSKFVIRSLYYLICALLPLAFFGSLGNSGLHLWLPTSLTLGIFFGRGISDCCALITKERIRRMLLRQLGADDPEDPVLPQYNYHGATPIAYEIESATSSDGSPFSHESMTSASLALSTIGLYDREDEQELSRFVYESMHDPWATE